MGGGRGYGEGCAVAHGLELIGERWALLIVRELLMGPKRFNALQTGILRASANVLSQRLQQMEQAGVVRHRRLGAPTNAWVWELTEWGYQLEPIVMAIGGWARSSPLLDQDGWFSPDALMLHLKARFRDDADMPHGRYQLRMADDMYSIIIDQTAMRIMRGELDHPDATIESDLTTLTAVIKRREPFDQAVDNGRIVARGNRDTIRRLLTGHR
jgi:DNA-binding HxlR family transcriptional regulator